LLGFCLGMEARILLVPSGIRHLFLWIFGVIVRLCSPFSFMAVIQVSQRLSRNWVMIFWRVCSSISLWLSVPNLGTSHEVFVEISSIFLSLVFRFEQSLYSFDVCLRRACVGTNQQQGCSSAVYTRFQCSCSKSKGAWCSNLLVPAVCGCPPSPSAVVFRRFICLPVLLLAVVCSSTICLSPCD